MKKVLLLIFTVALLSGLTIQKANAQASVTAQATAEVIAALTATETSQLNFGRFSPESQGGKVIVTPEGVRTAEGTVALGGGAHQSASFYITGEYDATFTITLPDGSVVLTNVLNSRTMQVSDWKSYPPAGMGVGKLPGGETTVRIGAVLVVGNMNSNPVGVYSGTYAITFSYN
ncbi:MAG TPA: DUF4402 domain-containing protein [Prolixibacteraceae bacterium]|nr:DUF4402 domain-containing protein [Prolixibacteraceae bacterium]